MIDSTYHTKPDRENTAVMGSSIDRLISFLFVWWNPERPSRKPDASPTHSWWMTTKKILKEMRNYTGPKKDIRVYLDVGSEGLEARLKPGYDEMVTLLLEKGSTKGVGLEYFYDEGAEHNERAWAKRLARCWGLCVEGR
jgi:predicted alpha/beta superfamily hydrolase